jgi:hypothetical protein
VTRFAIEKASRRKVNGAIGTSDMDRWAARVAARESGDERVQYHDEYCIPKLSF